MMKHTHSEIQTNASLIVCLVMRWRILFWIN